MKHAFITYLLTMAGLMLASCSTNGEHGGSQTADEKSIVIVFEGDTHCETGGYSRFAGLRDAMRQADTTHVVTVSLGDFMVGGALGAISKGSYITDIMRNVNYDIITLGNHEFDYGGDHMEKLLEKLGVPVTCANYYHYGEDKPVFAPYIVKQYGSKRVAFVGALAPETMELQQHAFYDEHGQQLYDLHANDLYELVQQAVDKARNEERADYVVLLSHIGEKEAMGVSSHKLIAATRGIDAVIDSHTHTSIEGERVKNADGKDIIITQAGAHMEHVGQMVIGTDGTITTSLIAIGEVGLDYYWSREFEREQLDAFEQQVQWSVETRLPLMIHCRKAQNEMVHLLKKYARELPGGVFHCFTGNEHEAEELLQFPQFVLGVGGVLTFKKSHLPEVLPSVVPLDRLVLETDSPYMAPVPKRGQRNEPAYVTLVMERMAQAYGISPQELEQHTNHNVRRVFGCP